MKLGREFDLPEWRHFGHPNIWPWTNHSAWLAGNCWNSASSCSWRDVIPVTFQPAQVAVLLVPDSSHCSTHVRKRRKRCIKFDSKRGDWNSWRMYRAHRHTLTIQLRTHSIQSTHTHTQTANTFFEHSKLLVVIHSIEWNYIKSKYSSLVSSLVEKFYQSYSGKSNVERKHEKMAANLSAPRSFPFLSKLLSKILIESVLKVKCCVIYSKCCT